MHPAGAEEGAALGRGLAHARPRAVVNAQLNGLSVSRLSELPAALLFTFTFFLLCGSRGFGLALLVGLVSGALVVRQNALPFVPWFLVFLAVVPERGPDPEAPFARPSWAGSKTRVTGRGSPG